MDFNLPAEDDPRRQEIRQWFEQHPNPTYKEIAERGLSAANWPAPWGMGADPELQYIIDEEFVRAGVATPHSINAIAVNQCGQSLLTHGTEEQRQRFIPPALACEEIWCMLFSEPSGGSDVAAVRTTARRGKRSGPRLPTTQRSAYWLPEQTARCRSIGDCRSSLST